MDNGLKKGLAESLHLELPRDGKMKTQVMIWVQQLAHHLTSRGMDGIFCIQKWNNGQVQWHDILANFGEITMEDIVAHDQFFATGWTIQCRYDRWDVENQKLSAQIVRNSLGTHLLQRVSSLLKPNATGPMVFKCALDQVMFMNATTIRTLINQLGALLLKEVPGESVPPLTETVTELAREIEGSGKAPSDLLNLVSKPHTKGTVAAFQQQAMIAHNDIMKGSYQHGWERLVTEHGVFYQDLAQSGDCPPAKSGKKDQDSSMQAMVAQTVSQTLKQVKGEQKNKGGSNKRGCYICGATDCLMKDCPHKMTGDPPKQGKSRNTNKDESNWRYVPPKVTKGESTEKKVNGVLYKWCGKCRQGKGIWTTGRNMHSTKEHRTKSSGGGKQTAGDEQGNLGVVDEPLEFGFCTFISKGESEDYPKGCGGEC